MQESKLKLATFKNSIRETTIWAVLLGNGNSTMPNKFSMVYAKFILAIFSFAMAYISFAKHGAFSLKAIVMLVLAMGWAALGTYNLLKLKSK